MKTALIVTTYNRPEYLRETLHSVKQLATKPDVIVIVDDASTNKQTITLVEQFELEGVECVKHFGQHNKRIYNTLKVGIELAINKGCTLFINLDSDAIVRADFIEKVSALHTRFPDNIVTGFNCLTKNNNGSDRHPLLFDSMGDGYNTKSDIGGINMAFNINVYSKYILPALNKCAAYRGGNWDTIACRNSMIDRKPIYCVVPSVVQHIGYNSSMGHNEQPDVADDFEPTHDMLVKQVDNEKSKDVIIMSQYYGLGDILFCIPIARHYIQQGYKVLWPVNANFVDINKHFPDITFVDTSLVNVNHNLKIEQNLNGAKVLPLRWSDQIMKRPFAEVMRNKYDMLGLDWCKWRECKWVRDKASENRLYSEVLGLKRGEKYNLINTRFRSNESGAVKINVRNNYKNIEMQTIEGFTLLDWGKVIENATEIHTVSTSINYVIELLPVKAEAIHLYVRKPDEKDFSFIDYLLTKPYVRHL